MAIMTNKLAQIADDLDEMQQLITETTDYLHEIGEAIDKWKNDLTTNATVFDYKGKLSELVVNLGYIHAEQNKLQAEFKEIEEGKNIAAMLPELKDKFQQFGCNLLLGHNADNNIHYTFDFGEGRCITVKEHNFQWLLVECTSQFLDFNTLKEYLNKSQDIIGLLAVAKEMISVATYN
ncbi:uncharacterized protein LOC135426908 [Drosophila montana]|uniref:uncharacterized protein LOC135426908 n=1 Tax=Drosophila montana TaxID=40370 RepID=UPI00313AC382